MNFTSRRWCSNGLAAQPKGVGDRCRCARHRDRGRARHRPQRRWRRAEVPPVLNKPTDARRVRPLRPGPTPGFAPPQIDARNTARTTEPGQARAKGRGRCAHQIGEDGHGHRGAEPVRPTTTKRTLGIPASAARIRTGASGRPTTRAVTQAQAIQASGPTSQPQLSKKPWGTTKREDDREHEHRQHLHDRHPPEDRPSPCADSPLLEGEDDVDGRRHRRGARFDRRRGLPPRRLSLRGCAAAGTTSGLLRC